MLEISSASYSPPAPLVATAQYGPSPPSSRSSSSTPRHHKLVSGSDGLALQPPASPSRANDSVDRGYQQGGRINEILGLGKSRSSLLRSQHHASQPSASSLSSSASSGSGGTEQEEAEEEPSFSLRSPQSSASSAASASSGAAGSRPRQLLKCGPLRKQSPKGFHLWQQRFVSLHSDCLQYCKGSSSRSVQGTVPLQLVKFVFAIAGSRRFDVVVGEESVARTFHFEANSETEAKDWVAAITRATRQTAGSEAVAAAAFSGSGSDAADNGLPPHHRGVHVSVSGAHSRSGSVRWRADGGPSNPTVSRLSNSSFLPSQGSVFSPPASPLPLTPVSSYQSGSQPPALQPPPSPSTASAHTVQERRGGEVGVVAVAAAIEVVESVDLLRLGQTFLCRERARSDVWHLMQAMPSSHPLAPHVRAAHKRMQSLHLPHLLTPLLHSDSADAVLALYTPALRPKDSLFHCLHVHRRLPEPVVKHVAVSCVRALTSLHDIGHQYRLLCPATLAYDGDGRLLLIDPLFSIANLLPARSCLDAEYQLPRGEKESAIADWWRLGLLLYELAVGLPPVRAADSRADAWADIAAQLVEFHPLSLPFPPFVSSSLQSLIRQLLMEADGRLGAGDGGDAEVTGHDFFSDTDWEAAEPPPAPLWLKQQLMRASVRLPSAASVTARTASSSVSSTATAGQRTTRMSPSSSSSSFGLSPALTPPDSGSSLPFFPSSLVVASLSPYEAYCMQRPPRNILTHSPPAAAAASRSSSAQSQVRCLRLTLLGGRNFPLPTEEREDVSGMSKGKRKTLDRPAAAAVTAVATHGVFVAVSCSDCEEEAADDGSVARVSRMVVGSAACSPSFGDEFSFSLPADSARQAAVELSMEIRHGKIGSAVRSDGGVLGRVVGSISLQLSSLRAACQQGQDIWHSIINHSGLVVGELHVRYAFEYADDGQTAAPQPPWWLTARPADRAAKDVTFEALFGVKLDSETAATTLAAETSAVLEPKDGGADRAHGRSSDMRSSRSLDQGETAAVSDFHSELMELDELYEPEERRSIDRALALASSSVSATAKPSAASLYSLHPSAADLALLHSVLPSAHRRHHSGDDAVDLSFITPRLIVMSSPVVLKPQPAFRNPLGPLQRCVDALREEGGLHLYQLSVESSVPAFGETAFAFAPASVLPFERILAFCRDAQAFLYADASHRIALHCLSGVGRCALLLCCFLLFDRQAETASEALTLFCQQRLSSPVPSSLISASQLRFVQYMQRYVEKLKRPSFNLSVPAAARLNWAPLRLTHIRTTPAPCSTRARLLPARWHLQLRAGGRVLFDSARDGAGVEAAAAEGRGSGAEQAGARMDLSAGSGVEVAGDFELLLSCGEEEVARLWLHSFFVGVSGYVRLRRDELDWAAADDGARHWPASELTLECFFSADSS